MISQHPDFKNAEGTIHFIRVIDRLFDLLNTKNPFGKGYKKPLRYEDKTRWISTIDTSISYLLGLKDIDGTPLFLHRRKTFVVGLVIAALSTKELAISLLTCSSNPFSYILTYKYSQDNLELLFSCIRGLNGWNNNPDLRQFKSSLKRILLRVSTRRSKYGNCENFSSSSSRPLFQFKWSQRRTPLSIKD